METFWEKRGSSSYLSQGNVWEINACLEITGTKCASSTVLVVRKRRIFAFQFLKNKKRHDFISVGCSHPFFQFMVTRGLYREKILKSHFLKNIHIKKYYKKKIYIYICSTARK